MSRRRDDLLGQWQTRLKEIECTSLTVSEYCRRNSLSIQEYYYWRKKINDSRVYAVREKEEDLTEVIFAPEEKESSGLIPCCNLNRTNNPTIACYRSD